MQADNAVSKKQEETDDFFAAFGHQRKEEVVEDTVITIEIWEDNRPIYDIYRVLQNWTTDWGGLSPELARDLIRERNLPLEETLIYIPYLHGSYQRVVNAKQEE